MEDLDENKKSVDGVISNATTSNSAKSSNDQKAEVKDEKDDLLEEIKPSVQVPPTNSEDFDFSVVELPDFPKTPQRNKEMHRFRNVLKSPFVNVPMLVVECQEDIFPVLSLYAQEERKQKKSIEFLSVTPADFGMNDDSDNFYDFDKKLNLGGTILEYGNNGKTIPIYCDLVDYMDKSVFGKFTCNFLKSEMPAILCVTQKELQDIRQNVQLDKQISGGLENPNKPYEPWGLARSKEIEISPLTRAEKHIYLRHYIQKMLSNKKLKISDNVCRYFVNQMIDRSSHQEVFFKVFELMNQIIVLSIDQKQKTVSPQTIKKVLREHAPVHNHMKALIDLDTRLKQKIYGQDQAIDTCYETILSDLDDKQKAKPTVLGFFGPSGVGKTALAEEISLALNGQKPSTINMAEYSDSFKVSILTGSSKGYVNSDEDGLLAKIVKENPKAVILLDEFEKAHPEVQQMFLGVFDKGSLFDNHSGLMDMSKTTIILTSNAGIREENPLGFGAPKSKEYVADQTLIQQAFPPELLGRMDAKILFNPLSQDALEKIVDKFMKTLKPRFDQLGVRVSLSEAAKKELVEKAKDPTAGARPILSIIRQKIKTPIEIGVLKNKIAKNSHIIIQNVDKKDMRIIRLHTHKKTKRPSQNTRG